MIRSATCYSCPLRPPAYRSRADLATSLPGSGRNALILAPLGSARGDPELVEGSKGRTAPRHPGVAARNDEPMEVEDWLKHALADADSRGLPELVPLLESLARATRALRIADWNLSAPDALDAGSTEDDGTAGAP